MKTKIILILAIMTTIVVSTAGQKITGLWEIKQVKVGDDLMTPVAKWTNIKENGTYTSGNGWLQNSEGSWSYDKSRKEIENKETNGLIDEFGAFSVSFSGEEMIWQREEEGMNVIVTFQRINSLPKSPADLSQGLWGLVSVTKNDTTVTGKFDPDGIYTIFIRWDRIYVENNPAGKRETGYWHMNGHRPEITFLPHNPDKPAESWQVTNTDSTLILNGISDSNRGEIREFKRLFKF